VSTGTLLANVFASSWRLEFAAGSWWASPVAPGWCDTWRALGGLQAGMPLSFRFIVYISFHGLQVYADS
jgi:hypothetical protein